MEKKENLYAQFDARVVQELEQRNEFDFCSSECFLSIGELAIGGALLIWAPPAAAGGGAALIVAGVDDVNTNCSSHEECRSRATRTASASPN